MYGFSMLWIPEDGDGIVDVSDLLAVISAWGATSP